MSRHERYFDWRAALLHGIRRAADNHIAYQDAAPWTAMWELLCEAAEVSRSFGGPPRSYYPDRAIWPEYPDEITPWQRQMAYLRGEVDEVDNGDPEPPTPLAAEVTRADMVLGLWHAVALRRGVGPHPHKQAIYRMAEGAPLGRIIAMTGLRRHEVLALRKRACEEMLRGCGVSA